MLKIIPLLIAITALSACSRDESISKFANPLAIYHLVTLDDLKGSVQRAWRVLILRWNLNFSTRLRV
jgi:uncharacterized lipoprotein YajG